MSAELRALAESIALEAGAELRARFHQARTIELKGAGQGDLVTDADRASEAIVLARLSREVPSHAILAEESGRRGAPSDFTWYVDPLDGTTNYAHGVPHFAVTLAVADAQGMLAGVVYEPLRDELFSAARGLGASLQGRPIRVSQPERLARALLATGFPYDLPQHPERPLALFARVAPRARGMRRFGSAALDLAWVAAGRFDGYYELGLKPWDCAAGALLVREAGGQVSALDGGPFDLSSGEVLAAPPGLCPELLAALAGRC